jgi:hypothetical protein
LSATTSGCIGFGSLTRNTLLRELEVLAGEVEGRFASGEGLLSAASEEVCDDGEDAETCGDGTFFEADDDDDPDDCDDDNGSDLRGRGDPAELCKDTGHDLFLGGGGGGCGGSPLGAGLILGARVRGTVSASVRSPRQSTANIMQPITTRPLAAHRTAP